MPSDDLFAMTHEVLRSIPTGVSGALGVLLVSVLLAWLKWTAEEGQRAATRQRSDLPPICTYPLCGKSLELVPAAERVQSKHCELEYCSSRCFKRDWRENNHPSVGTLLKRRREELAREEQARQVQKQRSWLDQLSDLIPEPQGLYRGELDKVFSSMSSQMEADAFTITARTFCQAYMAKFSMAVHGWSNDCYAASGRGAVVIHLSERALQQSFGAPLSYVSQRVVEILQDRNLSRMVQNYDPETQLVVYIFQRGVNKKHLAFPFCYAVYDSSAPSTSDAKPREGALGAQRHTRAGSHAGSDDELEDCDGEGQLVRGDGAEEAGGDGEGAVDKRRKKKTGRTREAGPRLRKNAAKKERDGVEGVKE